MKTLLLLCLALVAVAIHGATAALPEVEIEDKEAPDIRDFLDRSKDIILKHWEEMAEVLASPGFTPARRIKMVALANFGAPAGVSGTSVFYSAGYARRNPKDMGVSIHEATHIIQAYGDGCPGWITEGIADYIRYFHFTIADDERRKPRKPRNNEEGWKNGYGDTAFMLDYITRNKNKNIVNILNRACRENNYRSGIWYRATNQSVKENWEEMQRNAKSLSVVDLMINPDSMKNEAVSENAIDFDIKLDGFEPAGDFEMQAVVEGSQDVGEEDQEGEEDDDMPTCDMNRFTFPPELVF